MLQPICYLLDRFLCFRLEREVAGSDLHRLIYCLSKAHNNRAENAIRPKADTVEAIEALLPGDINRNPISSG